MGKTYNVRENVSTETATPLGLVSHTFKQGAVVPADAVEEAALKRLVDAGLASIASDEPKKPAVAAKKSEE